MKRVLIVTKKLHDVIKDIRPLEKISLHSNTHEWSLTGSLLNYPLSV